MGITSVTRISSFFFFFPSPSLSLSLCVLLNLTKKKNDILINEHGREIILSRDNFYPGVFCLRVRGIVFCNSFVN